MVKRCKGWGFEIVLLDTELVPSSAGEEFSVNELDPCRPSILRNVATLWLGNSTW